MYNPGYINNRPPSTQGFNELKAKGGALTSAGRMISGQEDKIQHNYIFRPDREKEKKELEAIELEKLRRFQSQANFESIAQASPNVFNSYAKNVDRINYNKDKIDAYANEIQNAKEKIYRDQQNIQNLQKLNQINAQNHKQHLQNQMDRIRAPISENDPASPFSVKPKNERTLTREGYGGFPSNANNDIRLDLLDEFSASQGLDDHLSQFAQRPRQQSRNTNGLEQLRNFGEPLPINPSLEQPLVDVRSFPNLGTQTPQANYPNYPNYPPYQYNQSPIPSYNQPYPYYPPQGYGFNASPMTNETQELKAYILKQNELLESLSRKLLDRDRGDRDRDRRTSSVERRRPDPREFENRLKDFEKETDLKMKLMKQQQMIDSYQQSLQLRNETQNDRPSQNDMLSPQALVQSYTQHIQPFQYGSMFNPYGTSGYDPYGYMYSGYGGYGMNPYDLYGQYPPLKGDKKKKKKKRHTSDSRSDVSSDGDPGDRKSSSPKKSKSKQSGKSKLSRRQRKKNAISNLKKILWAVVYPDLFKTDVATKVVNRKAAQQTNIAQSIEPLIENFSTWMINTTQDGLTQLFDDIKKPYDFIGLDFKKPSKSDAIKRIADTKRITKILIETLIDKTDTTNIDDYNMELLATGCYKNVYVSDNFFTNFELFRMKFSTFGRIIDFTKQHSLMRITVVLIIRIFVFQIIFKASEWNKKVKWNEQGYANLKIVASLVYHIACSIWEEKLQITNENLSNLNIVPLAPLSMDPLLAPPEDRSDDPSLILGVLTTQQLSPVLDEDKPWVNSVKDLILIWTEKIYVMIEEYRKRKPVQKMQ